MTKGKIRNSSGITLIALVLTIIVLLILWEASHKINNMTKQNIYDLAGNVWEWTLEHATSDDSPCACRGGSFLNSGAINPVSDRVRSNTLNADFSFRF